MSHSQLTPTPTPSAERATGALRGQDSRRKGKLCPLAEQESLDLWLLPPVLCLSLFLMFLEHIFFHVLGAVGWSGRQLLSSYDHCIPGKGAAISLAQQQTWKGPEDTGTEQVPLT